MSRSSRVLVLLSYSSCPTISTQSSWRTTRGNLLYHVLPNCSHPGLVSDLEDEGASKYATYILESKKLVGAVFPHRSCILQHLFQRRYFDRRLILFRFYCGVFRRCRSALQCAISNFPLTKIIVRNRRQGRARTTAATPSKSLVEVVALDLQYWRSAASS